MITTKVKVTENFYLRKQIWIDLVTNIDQSAAVQEKKIIQPLTCKSYLESLELPKDIRKASTIYRLHRRTN